MNSIEWEGRDALFQRKYSSKYVLNDNKQTDRHFHVMQKFNWYIKNTIACTVHMPKVKRWKIKWKQLGRKVEKRISNYPVVHSAQHTNQK